MYRNKKIHLRYCDQTNKHMSINDNKFPSEFMRDTVNPNWKMILQKQIGEFPGIRRNTRQDVSSTGLMELAVIVKLQANMILNKTNKVGDFIYRKKIQR